MFSYILYGFIWLISFLPFRILYLVADLNYLILYYVVHYRRKVVRMNLCNSFPEKSLREIKAIERKYYKHLADLSIELYKPLAYVRGFYPKTLCVQEYAVTPILF